MPQQDVACHHQHARRAEAALQGVALVEMPAQQRPSSGRCADPSSVCTERPSHIDGKAQARARRHRRRPSPCRRRRRRARSRGASRSAAAVAQEIGERLPRLDLARRPSLPLTSTVIGSSLASHLPHGVQDGRRVQSCLIGVGVRAHAACEVRGDGGAQPSSELAAPRSLPLGGVPERSAAARRRRARPIPGRPCPARRHRDRTGQRRRSCARPWRSPSAAAPSVPECRSP